MKPPSLYLGILCCFALLLTGDRAPAQSEREQPSNTDKQSMRWQDLRAVVRGLPLDSILVETDSPYLAPVPHRGKVNEPRHVVHVAEAVAEATCANFFRLFKRASSGIA